MVKARIYMVSLIDFINSISQTDDIQDVSARTVSGKVDLLARGGVSSDRSDPPSPLSYGPDLVAQQCFMSVFVNSITN